MRFSRRWPLLLVLLALAGCGWAAWRVHGVGRPIENVYASIQAGMTSKEVRTLVQSIDPEMGMTFPDEPLRLDNAASVVLVSVEETFLCRHGYVIIVRYADPPGGVDAPHYWDDLRVIGKEIHRPDWRTRLRLAFGT